ncbi:hypothetical protein KIPB_012425 [Kipferlia bialata]|uniref:Uncharacterized protein n=1 Tax=Kipferlia bialata TaxID=797122 RepID=A0A9K3D768_9EUKA|nr:hypothetical protein KIPB_012425 [Kipferlia bialata]|eukprot:g12425.t1
MCSKCLNWARSGTPHGSQVSAGIVYYHSIRFRCIITGQMTGEKEGGGGAYILACGHVQLELDATFLTLDHSKWRDAGYPFMLIHYVCQRGVSMRVEWVVLIISPLPPACCSQTLVVLYRHCALFDHHPFKSSFSGLDRWIGRGTRREGDTDGGDEEGKREGRVCVACLVLSISLSFISALIHLTQGFFDCNSRRRFCTTWTQQRSL